MICPVHILFHFPEACISWVWWLQR